LGFGQEISINVFRAAIGGPRKVILFLIFV